MAYIEKTQIVVEVVDLASNRFANIGRAAERTNTGFKSLVVGISGLATAAVSLYMNFDRIHHSQVQLDRANLMVKRSTETLDQATKSYSETVVKYGVNSVEAADAADKLSIAQDSLTVANERQQLAQENVSQTLLTFGVTVVPTVITALASLNSICLTLKISMTAILGPIGLVVAAIGALYYICSTTGGKLIDMSEAVAKLRAETTRMIAEDEALIASYKKLNDELIWQASYLGKVEAAYLEWYALIKKENEEWSDTTNELRNDFNILQAESSEALKTIAVEFDKALTGGNIDKATGLLIHFAREFGISIDDARRIIDDFIEALKTKLPEAVTEVGTAIETIIEQVDPLGAIFDELQSHWNLDKAEEAGSKYVEAYARAWKSGMIMFAMQAAQKLATDMNISLEEAINILDRLMDKMKPAEKAEKERNIWLEHELARSYGPGWAQYAQENLPGEWAQVAKAFLAATAEKENLPVGTQYGQVPSVAETMPSVEVTININAPLVNVAGSADRRTAVVMAEVVKESLKNVVVEASSIAADATHKQIRTQTTLTTTTTASFPQKGRYQLQP